jgi:hypothetical protein
VDHRNVFKSDFGEVTALIGLVGFVAALNTGLATGQQSAGKQRRHAHLSDISQIAAGSIENCIDFSLLTSQDSVWRPLATVGAGRGGPTHPEFAAFVLNESHVSRNLALSH